jgi:hypothetical protein
LMGVYGVCYERRRLSEVVVRSIVSIHLPETYP